MSSPALPDLREPALQLGVLLVARQNVYELGQAADDKELKGYFMAAYNRLTFAAQQLKHACDRLDQLSALDKEARHG